MQYYRQSYRLVKFQKTCPCVFIACSASFILAVSISLLSSPIGVECAGWPRKCLMKRISSVRNCLRAGKGASLAKMAVTISSL